MTNGSGSLGNTHLLAYISDGESAASVRALMHRQNVHDFAVEPGTAVEATEYLKSHPSPQTLVVEIPSAEHAAKLLDALADVVHPATRVIATGKVDTFSFYHWLMGLGVHDYLLQPFNEQQLASALAKGSASATPDHAGQKTPKAATTIAFVGARGGVGTTTLASAAASILAHDHQIPTALIDLDPQFGSVALALDLEPSRGLRDALEKPDRIDTLFLERVMLKPNPHLSILSAEESLNEQIALNPQAGELLFAALREKFALIVVDLPRQMNAMTRYVLDSAEHVIIVSEPSILSLRDALRLKDYVADTLKRPAPKIVINREGYAAKNEPPRNEFTRHLGASPAAYVPFTPGIITATSKGDDAASDKKLKAAIEPLRSLVKQLLDNQPDADAAAKKESRGKTKGRK